jgi:hypothetical protein
MSEKIYLLLLRLYPSQFRDAYGEEAVQLFRDRDRDEGGFLSKVRLWWDLLADVVVSLPREYRFVRPALARVAAGHRLVNAPFFDVLESSSPRPGALCSGALLSVLVVTGFSILINRAGGSVLVHAAQAAHAGNFHRIDDHFGMGIPEERPVNPYGTADWESVGVEPDVKVKPPDALDTAISLAAAKLKQR